MQAMSLFNSIKKLWIKIPVPKRYLFYLIFCVLVETCIEYFCKNEQFVYKSFVYFALMTNGVFFIRRFIVMNKMINFIKTNNPTLYSQSFGERNVFKKRVYLFSDKIIKDSFDEKTLGYYKEYILGFIYFGISMLLWVGIMISYILIKH